MNYRCPVLSAKSAERTGHTLCGDTGARAGIHRQSDVLRRISLRVAVMMVVMMVVVAASSGRLRLQRERTSEAKDKKEPT